MYCRCGNKIQTLELEYPDYCKECNVEIIENLRSISPPIIDNLGLTKIWSISPKTDEDKYSEEGG